MLYSQGIRLEDLGIPRRDGATVEQDARKIWRTFAAHYHLFRGTPTRIWLDHAFATVFGCTERLTAESADRTFDRINACLAQPEFRPRALFERFNIEVIATTESPLDPLDHHRKLRASGWKGRVITAYRPDPVVDPEFEGFRDNVLQFGALRARTRRRGAVTSPRTASGARTSRRWARRPPTTAIRRRARAICRRSSASASSIARWRARRPRTKPSSSAARC